MRSVQCYYKHLAIVGDSCWVQTEQSVCWLAGLTACSKHRISHVLHGVRIMKGVETSTLATYTLKKATAHGQNFVGKLIYYQIVSSSIVGERSITAQMSCTTTGSCITYVHACQYSTYTGLSCDVSQKITVSKTCRGRGQPHCKSVFLQYAILPRNKIIGRTCVTVALGYCIPPPCEVMYVLTCP